MELLLKNWQFLTAFIGVAISGVVWAVRLEDKVKSNKQLFDVSQTQSEKRYEKIDGNIGELFSLLRDVKSVVDKIEGRLDKGGN